jgi:hypothetical protein
MYNKPNNNYISKDEYIYKSAYKATFPSTEVYSVSKTIVVDSRQRNTSIYKNPSFYRINFGDVFKNITSVELKGAIIPKSSYNIHTSNNKIDFAIGDTVTSVRITDPGAGYTVPPTITFSSPLVGVTATGTAIINSQGSLTNIIITLAGSGYAPGTPPNIFISQPNNFQNGVQAKAVAVVGTHYTALLRPGEYSIGGNPTPPSTAPSGLVKEIQNAMNYAVNGGAYDPNSTTPFVVRVVNQYPELGAVAGTPESADTNSCLFNRLQVTNVNSSVWELLWGSGPNKLQSANSVFGFNMVNSGVGVATLAVNTLGGLLIPAGTTIRGLFDYNLTNDPDFVIMSLELDEKDMDRITSIDNGMDNKFAVILFDSNTPETLQDLSGTIADVGGVRYLEGATSKGTFWREQGRIKPIKGYDYDLKRFSFRPAKSKISSLFVKFTKFGMKPGGEPIYYDFAGREHTLIFEVTAGDNQSQQKD